MLNRRTTRRSKITIPEACHPLAKIVFEEMRRQAVTYDDMEWKSGVLRSTIKAWRTNNRPGLESIEATLGVLGWSVLPVPKSDALPAELLTDLQAVAERHRLNTLPTIELIAACVGLGASNPALIDARERKPAA